MLPNFRHAPHSTKSQTDALLKNLAQWEQWQQYIQLQERRKQIPEDTLLDYTFLDKGLHHLKTGFITLPKTILRGLAGANDFTFSEAMLVAKVPYYLGGLFLIASPIMGKNLKEGVRQGAAVLLYLMGNAGSHFLINSLYRLRFGIDLTMMYRSQTGQAEQVFASSDFPRFDLLKPRHYEYLARKMEIPPETADRNGAVRSQLRHAITTSRALKLVVGNSISAIGAGYIARSDKWLETQKAFPSIQGILKNPRMSLLQKASQSISVLSEGLRAPFMERLAIGESPQWKKCVVLGGLASLAVTSLYIWFRGVPDRHYVASNDEGPLVQYAATHPNSAFRQVLNNTATPNYWRTQP